LARQRVGSRREVMVIEADSGLNKAFDYVRLNGKPTLGDADALIASSVPPIVWSIIEFIRRRRVDALSLIVLTGIALSLLALIGGGGVRFLQLREKLVTGLIGLIFLGSAATGWPLMYQLSRATSMRRSTAEAQALEALQYNVHFRRTMLVMTLVWGFGLVAEAAVASVLVFALPIGQFMLVSGALSYGALAALGVWTAWYARRQRRRGQARIAAAGMNPPANVPVAD
jgi:hypothetical protein